MERSRTIATLGAAAALAALVAACDQRPSSTRTPDGTSPGGRSSTTTPMDQGQSNSDVRIAADIRKALMDEAGLSTNAKSVKVIVKNSAVTLRGVVGTQAEKDLIESKAKAVTGVVNVNNEIEVKS